MHTVHTELWRRQILLLVRCERKESQNASRFQAFRRPGAYAGGG